MRQPKYRAWLKHEAEEKRITPVTDMIFLKHGINILTDNHWKLYTDDEYELMESTGLKDKNGIEIFEGDIVKYKIGRNTFIEVVTYDKDFAGFGVKSDDGYGGVVFTFGELAEDVDLSSLEVVGNIYENPELLGE